MTVRLTTAISEISDEAKRLALPDPVIYTDRFSAAIIRRLLDQDLGGPLPPEIGADYVAMFDGVKIKVYCEPHTAFGETV